MEPLQLQYCLLLSIYLRQVVIRHQFDEFNSCQTDVYLSFEMPFCYAIQCRIVVEINTRPAIVLCYLSKL